MTTNQFTAAVLQDAIYRCERMLREACAAQDGEEVESLTIQLVHLQWKLERYLSGVYDANANMPQEEIEKGN